MDGDVVWHVISRFHAQRKVALATGNGGLLAILGPQCSRSLSEMVQARFIETCNYYQKRSPGRDIGGSGSFKDF
jgi:hypothetical protein